MKYTLLFTITILVLASSCRKDFETTIFTGNLTFSKDTLFLDTVFTDISSSTYSLKVYNNNSQDVHIPVVRLANGETSKYRLNVDGTPGKFFEDVVLLAHDSLFIFIEITADIDDIVSPLYTDAIIFDNGTQTQQVSLVTLVQDAVFLKADEGAPLIHLPPNKTGETSIIAIGGFYLPGNTTFTNEKPTVIYGQCIVPEGATLTIDAGAKVYFHDQSGLIVDSGATIVINGTLNEKVVFQGDRLESDFNDLPAQWEGLWILIGSENNTINHLLIKNGTTGIRINAQNNGITPILTLKNTEVINNAHYGILANNALINGENVVIGNSGKSSLACKQGIYNFTHCTFANYWGFDIRQEPTLLVSNTSTANFKNCIIDGKRTNELDIDQTADFFFQNCMIKSSDTTLPCENCLFNQNADFNDQFNNNFRLGPNSAAIDQGNIGVGLTVPLDILGLDRTLLPDVGAFETKKDP